MDFLYVIGISHKVADISIREKFYIPMDIKVNALETSSFNELLILATCNRTEIYVVSEKALQEKDLIDYVCSLAKQNASDFSNYFYVKQGDQVVDHLMHVCAGLDSVALGEDQILHQIS
ncbi:MAG: glutamyl-tRNA reductase, partial [Fibrobacter sp.]|nr:glutamyl-tRNA reductase [Fibrobacter sp.]